MTMYLILVLCLGGLFFHSVDCLSENSPTDKDDDLKAVYRVALSNSGPVIPGSNITFKAHLEDQHGLPLSDQGKYRFRWSSTADRIVYKETLNANKNSTWRRCFNTFVQPQEYQVTVIVFAQDDIIFEKRLASRTQSFRITETINGNINASQPLKFRHMRKGTPVYSTGKNMTLKLNVTDSALRNSSDLLHECEWYVDGDFVGNSTNSTELEIPAVTGAGVHNVSAFVRFYQIPDCNDMIFPSKTNRSGDFNLKINLKDPVEVVNVRGKSDVKLHHNLQLGVYFSGSPPFNACWSLQPVSNTSKVLNQSCSIEHIENEQNFTIFMNRSSLGVGQYVINITITNDVSLVEKRHYVEVSDQQHYVGPASILLPVVGGLIAVILLLAVTVFAVNKKMAKKNVETANFDFHPPSLPLVNSDEHERSLMDKIQEGLFNLFGTPSRHEQRRRTVSDVQTSQKVYGSCDSNSIRSYA